jgi:uncharacterized protein YecT (DUF1311 family)
MRTPPAVSLLIILMCVSSAAIAKCERNQYGVFEEMDCASEAARKADIELNAVYKRVLDSLAAPSRQKMIVAQRRWLAFRDAHRDFIWAEAGDGADGRLVVINANEKYTRARAEDLRTWIQQH